MRQDATDPHRRETGQRGELALVVAPIGELAVEIIW
jgi:hypothetical protein